MPTSENDQPKPDPNEKMAVFASEYKPTRMFTTNTEYKPVQPFIAQAAPTPPPAEPASPQALPPETPVSDE